MTLEELNEAFALWLKDDYHHKLHSGIEERPIDRYNASVGRVLIRRLSREELDEIFLIRHERVVNNDATISFKGSLYEVPAAISVSASRSATLSMTLSNSISMTTVFGWAKSGCSINRRTPAPSDLSRSRPICPFTKGRSCHERPARLVWSQRIPF